MPEEIKKEMRQIIIETDGNNITIVKADVAGNLELSAILSSILNKINYK
jgi:translation initiation factor IF-2